MRKKNHSNFNQRLLAQLSKFKQISTIASGHLQIKSLLAQSDIQQAQGVFTVLQNDTTSTQRAKKQYIKIYTSMIETYGLEMLNYFDKLLSILMKKSLFPHETSQVFAALTKLIVSLSDEEDQLEKLYYIQKAFEGSNKDVFIGTCLRCIIKQLPVNILVRMENQLCSLLAEKITYSKSKVQLIQALLSLLLALEQNFEQDELIRALVESDLKNQDWNVRKSLIDLFYGLLVLKGPTEKDSKIIEMVKQNKYDKIKTVRDAAINCLSIFKNQIPEQKTTPKKEIPKPWKIQPVVQTQIESKPKTQSLSKTQTLPKTQNIPNSIIPQNIKPKAPSKIVKTERNQSFFKKATLDNQIVITQHPEPSSIQYTQLHLDPLSTTNIQRRGFNDTIQHIQSMMPKGLSIAESMVFKNDESREDEEEKKAEGESYPIFQGNQEESGNNNNFNRFERIEGQIKSIHTFMIGFERTIVEKLAQIEIRVEKLEKQQKQQHNSQKLRQKQRQREKQKDPQRQYKIQKQRQEQIQLLQKSKSRSKSSNTNNPIIRQDDHFLIVEHPSAQPSPHLSPSPQLSISKQYPYTLNIQPYINSTEHTMQQIKNFSQDRNIPSTHYNNVREKVMTHLNQHNIQTSYQIIFTQGNDSDIMWLIQQTGMAVNELDTLHVDFLIYKIREFIGKGVELGFCLKWLEEYFRNGRLSANVEWGQFLRKIKCENGEQEKLKKVIVELESKGRI